MDKKKHLSTECRLFFARFTSVLLAGTLLLGTDLSAYASFSMEETETVTEAETTAALTDSEESNETTAESETVSAETTEAETTAAQTTSASSSDSITSTETTSASSSSSETGDTSASSQSSSDTDSDSSESADTETSASDSEEESDDEEESDTVTIFTQTSAVDLDAVALTIPQNLAPIREALALKAYSLVGQVGYFWGGKSSVIGWDSRWGTLMTVTTEGSESTGSTRSYGLDCSGFVAWVYINAFSDRTLGSRLGYTTTNQWNNSYSVSWSEACVGDLVFYHSPSESSSNHVGIIVDIDEDGTIWAAHCSSGRNNVIVSRVTSSNFNYVRRPYLMADECACYTIENNTIVHDEDCEYYTDPDAEVSEEETEAVTRWESVDQLTAELAIYFPDPVFAEAVAEALWETCGSHEMTVWEKALLEAGIEGETLEAMLTVLNISTETEYLDLTELGYETLEELLLNAQISVEASGALAEDETQLITDIEGIQYLRSAVSIDLSYNSITSLSALDYTRIDAEGNMIYNLSVYYRENGVWYEDAFGSLHEDESMRLYYGGGIPGSSDAYDTVLNLEGNLITDMPQQLPGRLIIRNLQLVESESDNE